MEFTPEYLAKMQKTRVELDKSPDMLLKAEVFNKVIDDSFDGTLWSNEQKAEVADFVALVLDQMCPFLLISEIGGFGAAAEYVQKLALTVLASTVLRMTTASANDTAEEAKDAG